MLEIASSLDTMMAPDTAVLVALVSVVVVSLLFDFTNGWNDSANAIATVVSTRVLKPAHAVMMNAGMNFVGALVSTTVAQTIASKWVDEAAITQWSVVAAMIAAAGWVAACTRMGIPCSGSHSLMGGIIGAALGTSFVRGGGAEVVKWDGITPAVIALFLSPLMGLIISYVVLLGCIWLASGERLSARGGKKLFGSLQVLSASFMAFQHGKNDAQKVMGVITLSLLTISSHTAIHLPDWVLPRIDDQGMPSIPLWVILSCATAMAIGTAAGGWEVIRTLGMKLAHIRPMEGFSAEMGAALTLEVASEMGIPVSTTHTITGSIMGVGSVRNPKAVKWNLGGKILIAWILTFPATIAVGWVLGWLLNS
ncbi:MAG: inorganic phosphate transporter [Candidatus Xenobium sp.]